MTNDEIERALDFLVKSQAAFYARQAAFEERMAAFDVRLEQTNRQIAETGRQLQAYAATQTEFIQIVTRHIEAQGEINASLRIANARTSEQLNLLQVVVSRTDERVNKTDERLDRLAAIVERNNSGGNGSS